MQNPEEKNWERRHEMLLKEWGEIAAGYQWLHNRSHRHFNRRSMGAVVAVVVLTGVIATFNFTSNSLAFEGSQYLNYLAGLLGYTATTITGVASKMGLESSAKRHDDYEDKFGALAREIRTELSLPVQERSGGGQEFVHKCRLRFDDYLQKAPSVPGKVLKAYRKQFGGKGLTLPNVLEVREVKIYTEREEERTGAESV